MADKDYRTETNPNIIGGCFKLPRIQVPKVFEEDDWGDILFKIETNKGVIKVSSGGWRRGIWKCRGDVPSLVAGGFIHPDWCPGLPGNNITRQRVMFKNNIPQLFYGNHCGKALPSPHITIIRISKNKFEVEVPATKKQSELIAQAKERWRQLEFNEKSLKEQSDKLKRKEEKRNQKPDRYSIPVFFKDYAIQFLNIGMMAAMEELRGGHEFSSYNEITIRIDEQSAQDILCASERLIEIVRNAKVICRRKGPHLSIVNSTSI